MKIYGMDNPEGSEIVNLTVPTGTADPSSPNAGELFFRTDLGELRVHDGISWFPISAPSGTYDLVNDTTPQLGGNLDTNAHFIQFDNGYGILDDSGNNMLIFIKASAAVNALTVGNAATGNDVVIGSTGTDANVSIDIQPKGTGVLKYNGTGLTATFGQLNYNDIATLGTVEASKTVTADANGNINFDTSAVQHSIRFRDGTHDIWLFGDTSTGRVGFYDGVATDVYWSYNPGATPSLNIGGGSTTIKLNGTELTANATKLNYNNIATLGTVEANKTVTADSSGNVVFNCTTATHSLNFVSSGTQVQFYGNTSGVVGMYDIGNTVYPWRYATSTQVLSLEAPTVEYNGTEIATTTYADLQRKNYLINGNFDIWQRATSQTGDGILSDDRWYNAHNSSTKTHSQQVFTVGQTAVPNNPRYYSRTVVTSANTASCFCLKTQKIEGVRTLAGKTATLSFWVRTDAAQSVAVEIFQRFGTGGTPSAIVRTPIAKVSTTTSFSKVELTFSVPSISGKTIGTNNDDSLDVRIYFDAGSDFNAYTSSLGNQSGTFDVAQIQLEEGSIATNFERRHIGEELALCQRYFIFMSLNLQGWASSSGQRVSSHVSFPTPLRVPPTATLNSTTARYNITNVATAQFTENSCYIFGDSTVAGTITAVHDNWVFDAEL